MNITITPSSQTIALMNKLKNPDIANNAIKKGLTKGALMFQSEAKQKAPVNTGNLRKNIKYEVKKDHAKIYSGLRKPDYAIYQEYGTGIYGKRHRPITPKRGKYLRFKSKTGKIVFAKSVKGVRPKYFFKRAGEHLKRRINEIDNIIYKELRKGMYA